VNDFGTEEAREIGESLGINWNDFNVDQFRMGLDVELEHGSISPETNITDDDPLMTGKIALAHLNELPDYYTRLKNIEKESHNAEAKNMPDMIRKLFTSKVKEVKGKERVLEFIGSTEVPDRDNEVIKADAWQVEKYTENPVVQWAHNYSEPPIGKTLGIRQNNKRQTIFEIEFADKDTYEFADTIYKLCVGGFLNATSVGFIPIAWDSAKKEGDPNRTFTKVELLEISIVPVPSNPEALISAREQGLISVKEFEFVTKPEETEDYIRIPVSGEGGDKHSGHRIRTIDISEKEGIKALYCGEDKVVITYLFAKDKDWTMAKAKTWVKEHEKSAPFEPKALSQKELKDELDFLLSLLKTVGISDEVKNTAIAVRDEIMRLTGSDIPDNINKSPIRGMISPVLKALTEHHESHEKCYKLCKDTLEELENGEGEEEEEDNGKAPLSDARSIVEEVVRQILNRREINA